MEVVGGLASIAQLTRYAISLIVALSDLHDKIRFRPEQLQQRRDQLESLASTVQVLSQCQSSNALDIKKHLETIISRIARLRTLLEREISKQSQGILKKYCKASIRDIKEQHIVNAFSSLESDKTVLLLSLTVTHTNILAQMASQSRPRLSVLEQTADNDAQEPAHSNDGFSHIQQEKQMTLWKNSQDHRQKKEIAVSYSDHDGQSPREDDKSDNEEKEEGRRSKAGKPNTLVSGHRFSNFKIGDNDKKIYGTVGERKGKTVPFQQNIDEEFTVGNNGRSIMGDVIDVSILKDFWKADSKE